MSRASARIALVVLLSVVAFGQSSEKQSDFLVADVHPSLPSIQPQMTGGNVRGDRYELRNATMVDLVRTAYGVEADKVIGGPSWVESDRFDVLTKVPAGTTPEAAKIMLQNLLADRFKLTTHKDSKPLPVFVLSMGKNAHKMKKSAADTPNCQPVQQPPTPAGVIGYAVVSCTGLTADDIATNLRQMAGGYVTNPAVNQTKLEGRFDFELKWTARALLGAAGSDGISLFDAVDKQLGLKLEAQKLDSPVIVVDSVNQKPTDNLPGVGKAMSDEAQGRLEFEVADIKPSAPDSPQQGLAFRYSGSGRLDAAGALKDYIGIAFEILPNMNSDLIVGIPKAAGEARYDIVAKLPSTGVGAADRTAGAGGGRGDAPPPISIALKMLRSLLEDRFGLKTHVEDREINVYGISIAKTEPKLKKAGPTDRASCKQDPSAIPTGPGTGPMVAWTCTNTTLAELAKNLPQWANAYVDHPVVDLTGPAGEGGWNFTLSWTPRGALQAPRPSADGAGGAGAAGGLATAADPGGLSLFEAVDKQLGLKLTAQKHMFPVTVVDHLEEKPKP